MRCLEKNGIGSMRITKVKKIKYNVNNHLNFNIIKYIYFLFNKLLHFIFQI